MSFDIDRFKNIEPGKNRYEKQLNRITEAGSNTSCIEETVNKAEQNLEQNINSFIIYGDPQSGKTEMMIALTAKYDSSLIIASWLPFVSPYVGLTIYPQ